MADFSFRVAYASPWGNGGQLKGNIKENKDGTNYGKMPLYSQLSRLVTCVA